jgi:hypothetical protein
MLAVVDKTLEVIRQDGYHREAACVLRDRLACLAQDEVSRRMVERAVAFVAEDAALLLAAEGRVGQDHVDPVAVAEFIQREPQTVLRVDLRALQPVQEQIHLAQEVRQRLGLAAEDALLQEHPPVLDRLALLGEVVVGLDEEPAGAAGRVQHGLAQPRVDDLDHEPDHGPGRVELAVVATVCRSATTTIGSNPLPSAAHCLARSLVDPTSR